VNRRAAKITGPARAMLATERVFTIPAPCRGGGFTFEVSVFGIWTGQGAQVPVQQAIERAEPTHREYLEKQLRELSRDFEPDAFAAAEECMNDELALPLTYEQGLLTCRSRARVGPDEALRKHLQKQWTDRSDDKAQHVRAKQHIEYMGELRELWKEFLQQTDGSLAAQAVRLASKPELVGTIASEMAKTKQETMDELRKIVDRAVDDHKRLEVYDFVTSYDSALRKLMQHLDIPVASGNRTGPKAA
ncbi:MAG: hypothetical protein LC799_16620, partial [Actinobacteria bacterium]|nr:hypothetical protein [Actinomycetota bacterium]